MESPRRALILYATQTGTAEDLSADLTDILTRLHFHVSTHSFESFSAAFSEFPTHTLVLFLVSTTGQGDFPDSATPLWRKLCRKKLPANWLERTNFGVFALGDTAYPQFCWAGKKVGRRLIQLGATEIVQRVEGDQSSEEGIEGAFLRWVAEVKGVLVEQWPLPEGLQEIPDDVLLPPKWILQFASGANLVEDAMAAVSLEEQEKLGWSAVRKRHVPRPGAVLATVDENTRITPEDHFQDVRKLTFNLPTAHTWRAGDTVSLSPKNFPSDVNLFLSLQNWTHLADLPLTLIPADAVDPPPSPIPNPIEPLTLRNLLTHHLAITAIPTRRFFSLAAHFAVSSPQHTERLEEFTDPQYIEELWDYTTRPRRNILEVLQEFASIQIPLQYLLSLVPRLRPREFSIASSSQTSDKQLDLLVAIVKYKTVIKSPRMGICTRWITSLRRGDPVSLVISRGALGQVPEDKPVLMIAPGTGVAPMRALVQSRPDVSRDVLYFGCRNKSMDFFFEAEWEEQTQGRGLTVRTAFSRDQKRKIYVQTLVREWKDEVWRVVQEGGTVFICGSSGRMPGAVREALVEVYKAKNKPSKTIEDEAIDDVELTKAGQVWLKQLETDKRYKQETW